MKYSLQDTDILSYYLKGEPKVVDRAAAYLTAFGKLDFSIITYFFWRKGVIENAAAH